MYVLIIIKNWDNQQLVILVRIDNSKPLNHNLKLKIFQYKNSILITNQ